MQSKIRVPVRTARRFAGRNARGRTGRRAAHPRAPRVLLLAIALGLAAGEAAADKAPSLLFYQTAQDQARSIDVDTQEEGPTVSGFLGAIVGLARNIQADGDDGLLWYSDTSGNIRSIVIATGEAGPTIESTVFDGANEGANRHFSIDPYANRLYYSVTDNSVQVIDIATKTEVDRIPSNAFVGAIVGGFRHTTIDPVNRLLYYVSTDNGFYSFSLDDYTQAGPSVPSNLVAGAAAGEFRHIIYDPNSGLIWYAVTDGSVASIDPVTHAAGPTLAANLFGADNPGAGRIITMSYEVLPEPATAAGALTALLTLAAIANRRRVRVS